MTVIKMLLSFGVVFFSWTLLGVQLTTEHCSLLASTPGPLTFVFSWRAWLAMGTLNDVMVNEGISMKRPTIMSSIEISQTRPYLSKIKM